MKKYFLSLAVWLFAVGQSLYAHTVTVSDAQAVALNFYKGTATLGTTSITATLKYTKAEADNTADFYVFDIGPAAGFVIVAADDNIIPILGYSTESNFNTAFHKTGLNHWVNKTAANIHQAVQAGAMADAHIQDQWASYRQGTSPALLRSGSVSPLCATTWDQENDVSNPPPYIYNLFCPYNNNDQQRTLTGCVATAMAQIMRFWSYPAQGLGSFSYADTRNNGYSNNYGTQSSDFSTHTYDWSQMPQAMSGSETAMQDTAVARLMYDCAVSVGMDFGDDNQDGSGAEALLQDEVAYGDSNCSQYAFVNYFSYDADTIRGVYESAYTSTAWMAVIRHEIDMGRPVLYEGNDSTQGGHAWVCDGYSSNNMLHMNWGWGGQDNGNFVVNDLTTTGNFNPTQDEEALIGIMPKRANAQAGIITPDNTLAFDMYPNPATGKIMLQAAITDNATWTIQSMLGQTMARGSLDIAKATIDIAGLPAGVYLVALHQGNSSAVHKLVVSR